MNNLEELSKPVAEVNSKYGDPEAFGERELNVLADIQKMPYRTKFYSQEYVDALIAQREAAQKELFDLHNQEFQQRLANAEHQLYMKDLAIHNIRASRKAQFRKRLAAEAALSAANEKLSKPVKLPKTNGYWDAEEQAFERGIQLARQEVRIAGFRVEGDE